MRFSTGKISDSKDSNTDIEPLESERLILRNFHPSDLNDFLMYRTNPEVCRYQDWEELDERTALEYIEEYEKKSLHDLDEWIQLAIELKSEGRFIGDCALKRSGHEGAIVEVGYTIAPAYQRKGYAYEALQLLICHLFDAFNIHKVIARVDPRNTGSLELLNRLGFTREGQLKKCFYDAVDKEWVDEVMFGLLREDLIKQR